jgi:hypothetical protein
MGAKHLSFRLFALCLILGILVLLMWPLSIGPYPATHGPVTALRATRSAVLIAWSLTIGIRLAISVLRSASTPTHQPFLEETPRPHGSWFLTLSTLRC